MLRSILAATGLVATLCGGALVVKDHRLAQLEATQEAARLDPKTELKDLKEFELGSRTYLSPAAPEKKRPPRRVAQPAVPFGTRLARLIIPKIGVDEIVLEGTGPKNLAIGLGRYRNTAPVGWRGTTAVSGHRTGWGSPLLRIDELQKGDRIVVKTPRQRLAYKVTRWIVVEPHEVWVLRGNHRSRALRQLVITTCTPPYTTDKRLVVFADLADARARKLPPRGGAA